ncbi:CdaR family protein [Oceanobacillus massiliensis]|uniref:CdaR family protein n=1 Tax=Oceanobacillus massiliensis TaxID=1465765 RepID=UPI003019CB83
MDTIEVTLDLEQTREFEAVPITEEELEDGQTVTYVEPESPEVNITVTGNESEIREWTAEDFSASINLSGLEPGEHTVPVTINGPENENITITSELEEVRIEIN